MIAYKLFRIRRDGSIGSLFINRKARLPVGKWMKARAHPTAGFAYRPGWHALCKPCAPHLSEAGRKWYAVEVEEFERFTRPEAQGGEWVLARKLKILPDEVTPTPGVVKVWQRARRKQSQPRLRQRRP